jgi:hypothetical protein
VNEGDNFSTVFAESAGEFFHGFQPSP